MASIEEYRYRHITPPKEVDWRKSGVVGPVKDQHVNGAPCGCCLGLRNDRVRLRFALCVLVTMFQTDL